MAKYLATDLDGTLLAPLDPINLIPDKNREVLKAFDDVLIVSGRNEKFIKGVCKELGIKENFVAYNGAAVYVDGKAIYKKKLDKNTAIKIIDYVKEKFDYYTIFLMDDKNNIYTINSDDEKRQKHEEKEVEDLPRHRYFTIKDKEEVNKVLHGNRNLMKMNIVVDKENKVEVFKQLRDSQMPIFASYCKGAIEVISSECSKGAALEKLVGELGIDKKEVYVIGDDNNDISMFDYFENFFLIKYEEVVYYKENYSRTIRDFAQLATLNLCHIHPSNFTFYHIVKYYIELTEAMEYTLITYKYQEDELKARFKFLKEEYKKGFFHKIIKGLFRYPQEITKELKYFIKHYNYKIVNNMVNDPNEHGRIIYNRDLCLAVSNVLEIINLCLDNERIKDGLEDSLIKLIDTTTRHFNLFYLFNVLNLYVASKVAVLQGAIIYELDEDDKTLMLSLLSTLEATDINKGLLKESNKLINEVKKFNEEDAYEVLNKVSIECIKEEKNLYTDFDSFSAKLEKEIEKLNK